MYSDFCDSSSPTTEFEVLLDGQPVDLPPQRRSPGAIRSYLETLAMEQQRILWLFSIDGEAESSANLLSAPGQFLRIIGETIALDQMPLQLVENAIQQTDQAQAQVRSAVTQVMINARGPACELWWSLTRGLKQPLLTLSLLPENNGGSGGSAATLMQLRRWQLEQLGGIIREVDRCSQSEDTTHLSDALESRVLPWLENLRESLELLRLTLVAARNLARHSR